MITDSRFSLWRQILLICIGLCVVGTSLASGEEDERGLGGTGLRTAALVDALFTDERGMGGTGIVGTITAFGSIWVNGVEIEYDASTNLMMDGEKADLKQLRLGQQVEVLVKRREDTVYAERISIGHELIGPVESMDEDNRSMKVLGQSVVFEDAAPGQWPSEARVGDVVSVSGYRDDNGRIQATDVQENGNASRWLLKGYAELRGDGLYLGDYPIPGNAGEVAQGDRVFLSGEPVDGRLRVEQADVIDQRPFSGEVETLLIEGERNRDGSIHYAGGRIRPNIVELEPKTGHRERDLLLIHQRPDPEKPGPADRPDRSGFAPPMPDRGERPEGIPRPEVPDFRPPLHDLPPEILEPPRDDFPMPPN